jgi:hypothetical protein
MQLLQRIPLSEGMLFEIKLIYLQIWSKMTFYGGNGALSTRSTPAHFSIQIVSTDGYTRTRYIGSIVVL